MTPLEQRLYENPGPKRILALDGGGVRGALSLEYLSRMERLLADRFARGDDFRLADYFDLIGGTSTGAIIAACLAKGDRVADIQEMYRKLAGGVFSKPPWRFGVIAAKYDEARLVRELHAHFEDRTLGEPELLTGLVVVTKRLDTVSTWPLHNFPRGKYFGGEAGTNSIPNRDYELARVVRASTAAPHFFDPERIDISEVLQGVFVDGGVSTANNPSLQLFLMATLKGFTLDWATGDDQLLLVSVGTGSAPAEVDISGMIGSTAAATAGKALVTLMADADALNQTLLQAMSTSPTATAIDGEIGDLADDSLAGRNLLTYVRYNVELSAPWLRERIGFAAEPELVTSMQAMDNADAVDDLARVGAHAAEQQIDPSHFPAAFDI